MNQSENSEVVIDVFSTLGMEMFGAGKKVLFAASANNFNLAKVWSAVKHYDALPSCVLLEELSYKGVEVKLKRLLEINIADYLIETDEAAKYYMNHRNGVYADDIVRSMITMHLDNLDVEPN